MGSIVSVFQGRPGRVSLFEIGAPVAAHVHPQAHVLIKLGGTDRVYEVGEQTCRLADDRAVLVNPWVQHGNDRAEHGGTSMLALYLEPGWIRSRIASRDAAAAPFSRPAIPVGAELRGLATDLAGLIAGIGAIDQAGVEKAVARLLDAVFDIAAPPRAAPASACGCDWRIRRAVSLMHGETARRGNVEHLARAVGLSRSRFYEQFKRGTGVAPGVFADGVRLDRAIGALIGSRTAICQISDQLGFPEQSHFTRFFRSKVGFAPSAYRRVAVSAEPR